MAESEDVSDYHPDGPLPVYDEAVNLLKEGVVKVDHFENIYRLTKKFEGAPNWRQAIGFNVFGSGQPSLEGLKLALDYYQHELGLKKLLCVNMRSEPVIYANNFSYGPRNPNNLNENIEISGLSVSDVERLQNFLVTVVRQQTKDAGNKFTYHKDTYALVPEDRKDYTVEEDCPPSAIVSLNEAYRRTKSETGLQIVFLRLPVNDERVPNLDDFDRLVRVLRDEFTNETGAHFNCQMGKGRTTTGMVLTCLVTAKLLDKPIRPVPREGPLNSPGTLEDGNYEIVRHLMIALGVRSGTTFKAEMDCIIDACDHLQNLRKCIWETKVQYEKELQHSDAEAGQRRAAFWKKLSANFIERYFYLILFNVYCSEQTPHFKKTFVDWCASHSNLTDILGTRTQGALSEFNWN